MNKTFKINILIFLTIVYSGCATNQYFQRGEEAFKIKNWDEAVEYYFKAFQDDPKNPRIRLSLAKAYINASQYHYELGEVFYEKGDIKLALIEFQKALDIYPENQKARLKKNKILKESAILKEKMRKKTELEIAADKMEKSQVIRPTLSTDSEMKFDFKFRDTWLYDIFNVLQKIGGINIVIDEHVPNKKVSIELLNVTFEQALENLILSNSIYYKIIDDKNIILIPNIIQKRKQYDELIVKTFYPSYIDVKELIGYLKTITKTEAIAINSTQNSITIRDTQGRVEIAERIIKALDKPKGDVLIDIEIIEVNKTRMREYGLDLSNYQIIENVVSEKDSLETGLIQGDKLFELNAADLLFSIPSMIYKFLSSDAKSKIMANPQIRVKDNEKAQINIGDKVPIPVTSFVPMAAGGLAQQPITSYRYENVGINIDIVPTIHSDSSITLEITFELTFITASGTDTTPPTIGNRSIKSVIRLRDGETNILAGLLKDEERKSLRGIPGIVNIPILRSLFSANYKEISQTDIVFTITPRILSYRAITESDISAFWVGPENNLKFKSVIPYEEETEKNTYDKTESYIGFIPQQSVVPNRNDFMVKMYFENLKDVKEANFKIQYDPAVVHAINIVEEDLLIEKNIKIINKSIDNTNGVLLISILKAKEGEVKPGKRSLLQIHFKPVQTGKTFLDFTEIKINSNSGGEIPFRYFNGEIIIDKNEKQ